MEDSTELDFVR